MALPVAVWLMKRSARQVSPGGLSVWQMRWSSSQARRAFDAVETFSLAAFSLHQYEVVSPPPEPDVRIQSLPLAAFALSSFETMTSTLATSLPELSEISVKETATAGCVYRGEG